MQEKDQIFSQSTINIPGFYICRLKEEKGMMKCKLSIIVP